jgi:hypothetical protein
MQIIYVTILLKPSVAVKTPKLNFNEMLLTQYFYDMFLPITCTQLKCHFHYNSRIQFCNDSWIIGIVNTYLDVLQKKILQTGIPWNQK